MRSLSLVLLVCMTLGLPASLNAAVSGSKPETSSTPAPPFPELSVSDEGGKPIPLFSLSAYQAEFRYLRRTFREVDLEGPAVVTDGWTDNIAEAEWPFMAFCYFGYACANLARNDPAFRETALEEMRWLIAALQTPRMSGFVAPHFGEPFGAEKIHPSVFVHGHFLSLALRYREASGDARYDSLIRRVAEALHQAFVQSSTGILKSYRDMWWLSDNLPALSALSRYDRLYQRNTKPARERFLSSVKANYLEARTGLLCTYVDAETKRQLQGPRGISTMYGLHFLKDVAPDFAADQYQRAHQNLVRETFGLAAVREFPMGMEGYSDIDSGPLVLGLGPSASGFAIAAAAVMRDEPTVKELLKSMALAAFPEFRSAELSYTIMPPVGQAVILFGKTELLNRQTPSRGQR